MWSTDRTTYSETKVIFLHIRTLPSAFPVILVCFYKQFHSQLKNVVSNAIMK